MARQHHGSGRYPADTAPTSSGTGKNPAEGISDRFDNLVVPKATPEQKAAALAYLARKGHTDVAEILGLVP